MFQAPDPFASHHSPPPNGQGLPPSPHANLVSPQEELNSVIREYGTAKPELSEARWDGKTLSLHGAMGTPPFFSQQLALPPDITLDIISDTIIRIEDHRNGNFYERSTGAAASLDDVLLQPQSLYGFEYLFIVSLPFSTQFGVEANLYTERYPYMPQAGHCASHGSGLYHNDIQEYLDTSLKDMLRTKDFAAKTSTLATPIGPLEVFGPNRYGEVLLCTDTQSLNPNLQYRFLYHPGNDTLTVDFQDHGSIGPVKGSFQISPPVFTFETPAQGWLPGGMKYDTRYRISPNPHSQTPFDSITLEEV